MAGKKALRFFKRLRKQSWRCKFLWSSFKWKSLNLPLTFLDDLFFKILSVFEAILLVTSLCSFYLFCGCNF